MDEAKLVQFSIAKRPNSETRPAHVDSRLAFAEANSFRSAYGVVGRNQVGV